MLFNFQTFVHDLRENSEKKEVIEKYEKFFGPIEGDIEDQVRYKEYVHTFPIVEYLVPEELANDFDRDLLMKLVSSSFSSDGLLEYIDSEEHPEFVISVQSWDQVVVKKISELWGFQILRLYEIYAEEQMNLQILIAEDEKEKEAILAQRWSRFNRWKLVLDKLDKEKESSHADAEKEEKLGDLYSQL